MHTINIKLTDKEMKALETFFYDTNACDFGCVWDECEDAIRKLKSQEACDRYCEHCAYTKAKASLQKKLGIAP